MIEEVHCSVDTLTAMLTRVSPAKLRDPGPSRDEVQQILAAAARAPDHGRLRPWRFFLIEGSAREQFGEVMARGLLRANPDTPAARLDIERKKPLRAPLVVVIAAEMRDHRTVPDIEQIVGVGAAVQNLLLAAHALGYGGLWRTGAAAYYPDVKHALGLAEADTIVGIVYIGSIDVPGKARAPEFADRYSYWSGGS